MLRNYTIWYILLHGSMYLDQISSTGNNESSLSAPKPNFFSVYFQKEYIFYLVKIEKRIKEIHQILTKLQMFEVVMFWFMAT